MREANPASVDAARRARLQRACYGAFVVSILLGVLTAIDLTRYLTSGRIYVGRENQLLTGWGAEFTIAGFALGAVASLAYGIYALWSLRKPPGARKSSADH